MYLLLTVEGDIKLGEKYIINDLHIYMAKTSKFSSNVKVFLKHAKSMKIAKRI